MFLRREEFDISKIRGQDYDGATCAFHKRHYELQKASATTNEHLLELGEIESSKCLNKVGTLGKVCDTHWGSHFCLLCCLLNMLFLERESA
uniref:Uncharacterized protein n=1 Tax=Lactuca sativa TaxID=4236 RepID=A0A9R1WCK5_LACSA|nr:hypothetical protein LSAT_V11C200074990 [Lactuca sativa]